MPLTVREDVPEGGFWTKYFITNEEFRTIAVIAALCAVVIVLLGVVLVRSVRKKTRAKRQSAAQKETTDENTGNAA